MCGGTCTAKPLKIPFDGLSPRVRGNPHHPGLAFGRKGSIPACAGEPAFEEYRRTPLSVYPRVCGGTAQDVAQLAGRKGLSPRVRGNPGRDRHPAGNARSIPACAGEPRERALRNALARVYPRVCGGTPLTGMLLRQSPGLSPRVRGNPRAMRGVGRLDGSIPACAGEPRWLSLVMSATVVYPRVCGGTPDAGRGGSVSEGLSPRVRGNRLPAGFGPAGVRSIPACAGEPNPEISIQPGPGVYPRVCGGTALASSGGQLGQGLSPRVRGNPPTLSAPLTPGRSIPACAGEPPRKYRTGRR